MLFSHNAVLTDNSDINVRETINQMIDLIRFVNGNGHSLKFVGCLKENPGLDMTGIATLEQLIQEAESNNWIEEFKTIEGILNFFLDIKCEP